jgi:hypothetical protein
MIEFSKITKEAMLYSSIIVAGTIFILKKVFKRRKVDKEFYDRNKKKVVRRAKLFFSDVSKNVEIKQNANSHNMEVDSNNKYIKMKKFIENVSRQYVKTVRGEDEIKTDKEQKTTTTISSRSSNKKDQIFYYLLNNISNMMIVNKEEKC